MFNKKGGMSVPGAVGGILLVMIIVIAFLDPLLTGTTAVASQFNCEEGIYSNAHCKPGAGGCGNDNEKWHAQAVCKDDHGKLNKNEVCCETIIPQIIELGVSVGACSANGNYLSETSAVELVEKREVTFCVKNKKAPDMEYPFTYRVINYENHELHPLGGNNKAGKEFKIMIPEKDRKDEKNKYTVVLTVYSSPSWLNSEIMGQVRFRFVSIDD